MEGNTNNQVGEHTETKIQAKYTSTGTSTGENEDGHGSVVAHHYNTLEEKGLAERNKSRILYLRNFNNWMKSMLINEYFGKIREVKTFGTPLRVLDMCCGKGGDLFKWRRGNITHLICVDLAETSVEQCQKRYNDLRCRSDRGFSAEFFAADCTKVRLRERYKDPSIQLDLVSCQFAFHYCFESFLQAECMLRNAAECLQPGGYFIGTIPDANEIMRRLQKSEGNSFGNDVYKIEFLSEKNPPPLFGAKYNFHLEDVVDCPEFLVHFPTLVKLAEKFDLQLIMKERFQDYFERSKAEGKMLLGKMQAFETYPPHPGVQLVGHESQQDYEHVEQCREKLAGYRKVGTLSKPEWEAASLYLLFAFQKKPKK